MRLALLLLAALWLVPRPAAGHAALIASEPADGAQLAAVPAAVVLLFDEPVVPLALRVGGAVTLALPLPPAGAGLRVALPAGLGPGGYVVSWRVVSADGHPVGGAFAFGVGTTAPTPARVGEGLPALAIALRAAFLGVFALVAGGALFRGLVAEPPRRVLAGMRLGGLAALGLALLAAGVQGALLAEAPSAALFMEAALWRAGLATPAALSSGVTAAGLLLAAAATWGAGRAARALGVLGAAVAVLGVPLAGHSMTAEPRWLGAVAVMAHAAVAALWLGALWPLRALLADRGAAAVPALQRFSRRAVPAVAVLLLAGTGLAALRLGSVAALFGSGYGQVLLVKLGGVGLLLGLAAYNRQRLTPALAAGRPGAAAALARSIAAELGVAALILAATAVLARTPPPGGPGQRDIAVASELGGRALLLEVSPGRTGLNRLLLSVGGATPPGEAWVEFRQPALGIGPLRRPMRPAGPGRFDQTGSELAIAGRWIVRVELLIGDFEQLAIPLTIDLPAAPR